LGRSQSTFNNYSRVAGISLYFGKIPTELDAEQVQDYLFYQQKSPCLAGRPAKPLRKRILNIAFTDFGFAKI
jgi:hypothetical protein